MTKHIPACVICNPKLNQPLPSVCDAHAAKATAYAQRNNVALRIAMNALYEDALESLLDEEEDSNDPNHEGRR